MPQYLHLRDPSRDTVLYPAISYPTYEMGAILAGCRPVAYGSLDEIRDVTPSAPFACGPIRPANPTGDVFDLAAFADWGRARDVPVVLRRVLRRIRPGTAGRRRSCARHAGADRGAFTVQT